MRISDWSSDVCSSDLFKYKYLDELSPRVLSKPLTRGKWFHSLLETYYRPDDDPANGADGEYRETWEDVHRHMSHKFSNLFDEETEELGDLPREMQTLERKSVV